MNRRWPFEDAPRCSATSKRTRDPCKAPAVRGWTVCRFHGAGGGAPRGERHGRYQHGRRTLEAAGTRALIREALALARAVEPPAES